MTSGTHRGASRRARRAAVAVLSILLAAGCARMPPDPRPKAAAPKPPAPAPEVQAAALPRADRRALRIDLGAQHFRYYEDGRLVRRGPVSAGSAEHPTPTGEFRVLGKDADKVSRSYTNAFDMPTPMPWSLQFHGPYFIHEGWLPGYPDSHGCVRLRYEDARFLFERIKLGDAVVIHGPERAPQETPVHATVRGGGPADSWLSVGDPRQGWSPQRARVRPAD